MSFHNTICASIFQLRQVPEPEGCNSCWELQQHFAFIDTLGCLQALLLKPWVCLDLAWAALGLEAVMTVLLVDRRLQSQQSKSPVLTAGQHFD